MVNKRERQSSSLLLVMTNQKAELPFLAQKLPADTKVVIWFHMALQRPWSDRLLGLIHGQFEFSFCVAHPHGHIRQGAADWAKWPKSLGRYFLGHACLDHFFDCQDGWKSDLGMHPAMLLGSHPLDNCDQLHATLGMEHQDGQKQSFLERAVLVGYRMFRYHLFAAKVSQRNLNSFIVWVTNVWIKFRMYLTMCLLPCTYILPTIAFPYWSLWAQS